MNRKIRLSGRAKKQLDTLLIYLENEWSVKIKNNFILKIEESFKLIQGHPDSFPASEKIKGLRKCVVTKQTTFYYKYSETTIDIITLFDNRRNPQSMK